MSGAVSAAATWARLAARHALQERLEVHAIDAALRLAAVGRDPSVVLLAR